MPSVLSRTQRPPASSPTIERHERTARILRCAQDERSWCHAGFAGCAFLVVIALLAVGTPVTAQEGRTPPHVRPEPGLRELVAEAARRSPVVRGLIDGLERLDVTVYIRTRLFSQTDLDGRVALLSSGGAIGRARLTIVSILHSCLAEHHLGHLCRLRITAAACGDREITTFMSELHVTPTTMSDQRIAGG